MPSIRRLSVLALALALAAACSSPAEQKAEYLADADRYIAEGSLEEAIISLRNALKLDPKNADINARIAVVLEREGAFGNALFFREEAHRLAPQEPEHALALAKLLMFEEPERAAELIDGVLENQPAHVLALVRRSELALARADSAGALEAALTAVEIDSRSAVAQLQLGLVHRARIRELQVTGDPVPDSRHREALAAFDATRGLAADLDTSEHGWLLRAWLERANVYASWPGHQEEAAQAFREAAEHFRGDPQLERRVLAATREYLGVRRDEDLRRWMLERSVELMPGNLMAWLALAALTDPPDAETSSVLKRLIAERPTDARAQALYVRDRWNRAGPEAAIAHAEAVAEQTEDPAEVMAAIARLHLLEGDVPRAAVVAEGIARSYPDSPGARLVLGEVRLAQGRYNDSVKALSESIERRESVEAARMLAEAYVRLGDLPRALDSISRALELSYEAEPVAILREKARIELLLRDYPAAVHTYAAIRRALDDRVQASDAVGMARANYGMGRADAAQRFLLRALSAPNPPTDAAVLYARREGRRDPDGARRYLEAALARDPDNPALAETMSRLEFLGEDPESAMARLDAAVEANPDSVRMRLLRARLLGTQGRLEEAIADARRALELSPGHRGAADLLVQLYAVAGKRDEAIATLEADDAAGRLDAPSRILLARLHLADGEDDRAVELFEAVLAERSDLPGVKNDLAFLLASRGTDLERALTLAREAREAMPRSPQVADTLGYVYLKKDLPGPAADQFREALAVLPEEHRAWPSTQYHLGLALRAQGKDAEAAEAFEKALATAREFPEAADARSQLEALRTAGR